jgi:hypothetical protein
MIQGSHIYWITSTLFVFIQNYIMKNPIVMAKINPTFYEDMQKVFKTERNREDSERYIEKLKKCESTNLKSPTDLKNVLYELSYERTRMNLYLKNLKIQKKVKKGTFSLFNKLKEMTVDKFRKVKKESSSNENVSSDKH